MSRYPVETLHEDEDDGMMPENVAELEKAVIGRRIVSAEREEVAPTHKWGDPYGLFTLTLDDGTKVRLRDTSDCCASTDLEGFLLHPEMVDHAITGVGTTEGYTKWHIYADLGDVLELDVNWSCGNPFYHGYRFSIAVEPVETVHATPHAEA
jgi:hypothetical protein